MLDGFGGHALAAGLYFSPEKTSFEKVKEALIKSYNEASDNKAPTPILNVDLEIEPEDLTENLIKDISRLEPFGASNPSPIFSINNFQLKEKKLMGSNSEHLRLTVGKNGLIFNAIWWSYGDIGLKKDDTLDIAFSPQINSFNGNTSIQLIIKDVHSDCFAEEEVANVITYDNRKKTNILDKVNEYLKTAKFNFCVFAEKNSIKEKLKKYPEIYKRILDRNSLKPYEGIMFFDYPPTEEIMKDIINKVNPIRIHYMNYDIETENNFDYIKTIAGMMKYVCNSKNGKFDLNSSACFLGITNNMVETLLDMYENCGCIEILERGEDFFVIDKFNLQQTINLEKDEYYKEFKEMLSEVMNQRKIYMSADIKELV